MTANYNLDFRKYSENLDKSIYILGRKCLNRETVGKFSLLMAI